MMSQKKSVDILLYNRDTVRTKNRRIKLWHLSHIISITLSTVEESIPHAVEIKL
jgi:hypothetical protein